MFMKSFTSRVLGALALVSALAFSGAALAEDHGDDHAAHGAEGEHGGHHVAHFSDVNWIYGFLGEKEGVEPSVLYRPVGMPIPVGALIFNTAVLFFLIGKFGGPAISGGLRSRKERVAGEIERSAEMKAEAESQLKVYEDKLKHMDAEMERIKKDMREAAEREQKRLVDHAEARRKALEEEARHMVEQQLAHARSEATRVAIDEAVRTAGEEIQKALTKDDSARFAEQIGAGAKSHFQTGNAS